jgi:periplasmic divalent cation tolerance protein
MQPELIEVITTTAEKSDAHAIANALVERRLAGCTQISGPLESMYWWNDRMEVAREYQVVVKTRGDLYAQVESAIRELHPYDVPEILAIPVSQVSSAYRDWLLAQLALPRKGTPDSGDAKIPAPAPVEKSKAVKSGKA